MINEHIAQLEKSLKENNKEAIEEKTTNLERKFEEFKSTLEKEGSKNKAQNHEKEPKDKNKK